MTTKKFTLVWHPLPKSECPPSNQLERLSDNKYALVCSQTTVIKAKEEQSNYRWKDLGLEEEVSKEIDLKDLQGELQLNQGIRLIWKRLVKFDPTLKMDIIKSFNKSGFITFDEVEQGFLLPVNVSFEYLSSLNGVTEVNSVSVVQRKEYTPTLLPTGIFMSKLPWHLITRPDAYRPYQLASEKVDTIPQLFVPVHSLTSADATIISKGELIAELTIFSNNKEINLVKQTYSDYIANV